MAILHKKEEKIQAVLGRLSKKYTQEEFIALFIKLYSKDWGKIKSAYIKQAQDKEPGTVINMPKPELYLKQLLEIYLTKNPVTEPIKVVKAKEPSTKVEPIKAPVKNKIDTSAVADKKMAMPLSTKKEKATINKKEGAALLKPKATKKEK